MFAVKPTRPLLLASMFVLGFFFLLLWFYVTNLYQTRFFETGGIVVAYQAMRIVYIPYLIWLQYALGRFVIPAKAGILDDKLARFITCFFAGTAIWHIALLIIGLAGFLYYPVMLAMVSVVMLASIPHMAKIMSNISLASLKKLAVDEKIMALLVALSALAFILFKGTYPSGGHDFFSHYFTYYKEVAASGNLGPHETWYHYYYSKGLGLYFLSMILLDPFAIHLVTTGFVMVAACMVFSFLYHREKSLLLPLFGAAAYLLVYIYTPGRGIFALNGGWGDLEKIHELTAALILACVWLCYQFKKTNQHVYVLALHLTNAALVIIGFACGTIIGAFYVVLLLVSLLRKEMKMARLAFFAGASTAVTMVVIMIINYYNTGVPQDQLAKLLWWMIDWKKVVSVGYTLELYSHLSDLMTYDRNEIPLLSGFGMIAMEFFRMRTLAYLLVVGAVLVVLSIVKRTRSDWRKDYGSAGYMIGLFLLASLASTLIFGGLRQPISYFRFSTFNYAPMLLIALFMWGISSKKTLRFALSLTLVISISTASYGAYMRVNNRVDEMPRWLRAATYHWGQILDSSYAFNTGNYSLYDAITHQYRQPGRLVWGGTHPALTEIYKALPPKTKIWSFYNHSYCLLPTCNVQMYHSQITSKRWYDIALGSIAEGKKIMQDEGTNFFFYSLRINTIGSADAKDQMAGFYDGFLPENIEDTLGILWTNGREYLLTWKEESAAPLDAPFMDAWRDYHATHIARRQNIFPAKAVARLIKDAVEDPSIVHPPLPNWVIKPYNSPIEQKD